MYAPATLPSDRTKHIAYVRKWKGIYFDVSRPASSPGTKYGQDLSDMTLMDHIPRPDNRLRAGVRMEDCALASAKDPPDQFTVVIADGHGSSKAIVEDGWPGAVHAKPIDIRRPEMGSLTVTRYIGGPECAIVAARECMRRLDHPSTVRELRFASKQSIAGVLHEAFAGTQSVVIANIEQGARPSGSATPETPEACRKRCQALFSSPIDGNHFRSLHGPSPLPRGPRVHVEALDKVSIPYEVKDGTRPPYETRVIAYQNENREITIADYGCTLTAIVGMPRADEPSTHHEARIVVANAGDSDAYLFHREYYDNGTQFRYKFTRLTQVHSTDNPDEVQRVLKAGGALTRENTAFRAAYGDHRKTAIMPSRSFGHHQMRLHGVISEPSMRDAVVMRDDVIVVASDGLWQQYGADQDRNSICERMYDIDSVISRLPSHWEPRSVDAYVYCRENMSAAKVCQKLDELQSTLEAVRGNMGRGQIVANELLLSVERGSARRSEKQDNVAIVAIYCRVPELEDATDVTPTPTTTTTTTQTTQPSDHMANAIYINNNSNNHHYTKPFNIGTSNKNNPRVDLTTITGSTNSNGVIPQGTTVSSINRRKSTIGGESIYQYPTTNASFEPRQNQQQDCNSYAHQDSTSQQHLYYQPYQQYQPPTYTT